MANKEQIFRFNDGDIVVAVDSRGRIHSVFDDLEHEDGRSLELTGKELDQIVAAMEASIQFRKQMDAFQKVLSAKREYTQGGGDTIVIGDEGLNYENLLEDISHISEGVGFGCQTLTPAEVRRVHKASRAARGLK